MFRFTIRDAMLVTTTIAILLAWRLDHSSLSKQLEQSEAAHRNWHFWAEHLRGQFNGKWLMPYRLEFSPDSETIYSASRQAGGDWVAPAGTTIEWRQDWAKLR